MDTRSVVMVVLVGVLGPATALALAWSLASAACNGAPGASPMHWLRCIGLAEWADRGPQRWEAEIQRFEQTDRSAQPPQGGMLFVGSSTIAR